MEKALEILKEIRNIENEYDHLKKHRFDEAIEELEEAMKPKTCDSCKHLLHNVSICMKKIQQHDGSIPKHFYCSRYEPKDTQC